ncbi:uncharacterized protein LOC116252570 isoform X2 [Nymphaea colorata]|uniref:uncharacterized protein LOC116252570 isoform X2 n=1 Tax=Nymphaea colorata TaxID=210225 RepID=UPI00129E38AD|nr:uncharacterized protein LOC116252570 isoform X2 [Nymphaea colorata]
MGARDFVPPTAPPRTPSSRCCSSSFASSRPSLLQVGRLSLRRLLAISRTAAACPASSAPSPLCSPSSASPPLPSPPPFGNPSFRLLILRGKMPEADGDELSKGTDGVGEVETQPEDETQQTRTTSPDPASDVDESMNSDPPQGEANSKESCDGAPVQVSTSKFEDSDFVPKIGLEFDDMDAAESFYNAYAGRQGFKVRVSGWYRNVKGVVTRKEFKCSKAGFPKENTNAVVRVRGSSRCGCPARMVVRMGMNGRLHISDFEERHNHKLATPTYGDKESAIASRYSSLSRTFWKIVSRAAETEETSKYLENQAKLIAETVEGMLIKSCSFPQISPRKSLVTGGGAQQQTHGLSDMQDAVLDNCQVQVVNEYETSTIRKGSGMKVKEASRQSRPRFKGSLVKNRKKKKVDGASVSPREANSSASQKEMMASPLEACGQLIQQADIASSSSIGVRVLHQMAYRYGQVKLNEFVMEVVKIKWWCYTVIHCPWDGVYVIGTDKKILRRPSFPLFPVNDVS